MENENKNKKFESELDFKSLLKDPLRLFGWSYIYIFVIIVALGVYYVKSINAVTSNATNPRITPISSKTEVPMAKGGLLPAVNFNVVSQPNPEMLEKGKELYTQNCASCHGDNGLGNGVAGATLNPAPRNFVNPVKWTNGNKFSDMYKTLQEGILTNGMAAYEYIPVADRFAIIHYVRTFGEYPELTDSELSDLDLIYNLTQETLKPNTIPVDLAIEKLTTEEMNEIQNISSALNTIAADQSLGAQLLKANSWSLTKVLYTFNKSGSNDFASYFNLVQAGAIDFGYRGSVLLLNEEEMKTMFDYLLNKNI
ncbi:MAG: cytochrome c [Melioribacteraceae bacterium]|nr:cytochrome c [Melioribacteraceae bacterium]